MAVINIKPKDVIIPFEIELLFQRTVQIPAKPKIKSQIKPKPEEKQK